jgi:hypothetical protein
MCMISIPESWLNQRCHVICADGTCEETIQEHCPDMLYVPAVPILFGHVSLLFETNDSSQFVRNKWRPKYVCYKDSLCSQFGDQLSVLSYENNTCHLYKDIDLRPTIDSGKSSFAKLDMIVGVVSVRCLRTLERQSDSDKYQRSYL